MKEERFSRSELLIGKEGVELIAGAKIIIFGIGGVGSYSVEALARCGTGSLTLVDHDLVSISNINRQLPALTSTIGRPKVDVVKERIMDINPLCRVAIYQDFVSPENVSEYFKDDFDYVIDAIDFVPGKTAIIKAAKARNIPVISAMGAGNKLHPDKFIITDISQTHTCPLARVMRKELKKAGIESGVKVVYSTASPEKITYEDGEKRVPGSIAFVPAVSGLYIAGEVINDLLKNLNNH